MHFNKQRIKTCRELINEIKILLPLYSKEKGARTDLTSVPENKGFNARDMVSEQVGLSSSQVGKLLLKQFRSHTVCKQCPLTVVIRFRYPSVVNQTNLRFEP